MASFVAATALTFFQDVNIMCSLSVARIMQKLRTMSPPSAVFCITVQKSKIFSIVTRVENAVVSPCRNQMQNKAHYRQDIRGGFLPFKWTSSKASPSS